MEPTFPTGTRSALGREVSAEVRSRMAAERIGLREFAANVGFSSHNYVAIRNRDEKAYTLDDVELICHYYNEDPHVFIRKAIERHGDLVWGAAPLSDQRPNLRAVADEDPDLEQEMNDQQEMP